MTKVLFITYDFPYPINSGGKSRAYHLIKYALSKEVEVILFSFTRPSFKKSYEEELKKIGVSKIYTYPRKTIKAPGAWGRALLGSSIFKGLYFEKNAEKKILEIIKNDGINVVQFESFYTSFYISEEIRELGVKQIFGTENIEHMLYYDFAKSKPTIVQKPFLVQVERVRREEEQAYDKSDTILAVTKEEEEYIQKKTKTPVIIVSNGVDTKALLYRFKQTTDKNLLFVGNFSYFPNVDAIEFFYKEVFSQIPDATLTLVGKHQDRLTFLKHDNRVIHTDYIDDIKDAYYNADVFVFPVRFGGGTNFKVLEASSCGTPIIAIPDRVKGLGFRSEKEYLEARTAQEFISGIQKLLGDEELRQKLSKNAREVIEENYDWKKIGEKQREVWQNT